MPSSLFSNNVVHWEESLKLNWLDCDRVKIGWTWVGGEDCAHGGIWLSSSSYAMPKWWEGAIVLTSCPLVTVSRLQVNFHEGLVDWMCSMCSSCWIDLPHSLPVHNECLWSGWVSGLVSMMQRVQKWMMHVRKKKKQGLTWMFIMVKKLLRSRSFGESFHLRENLPNRSLGF